MGVGHQPDSSPSSSKDFSSNSKLGQLSGRGATCRCLSAMTLAASDFSSSSSKDFSSSSKVGHQPDSSPSSSSSKDFSSRSKVGHQPDSSPSNSSKLGHPPEGCLVIIICYIDNCPWIHRVVAVSRFVCEQKEILHRAKNITILNF